MVKVSVPACSVPETFEDYTREYLRSTKLSIPKQSMKHKFWKTRLIVPNIHHPQKGLSLRVINWLRVLDTWTCFLESIYNLCKTYTGL